ncbi:hypothetical protein [Paenibacillus xylaniclasticus]|uniref:hypothetical protein n=1 Tax=Paenibacillus xylaniclasticus TaxID=588083 RepID=UPI000FD9B3FE|nr:MULTISPECIES: hypothetical protein [Paenibacillus]GFN30937.1 hypothetical protein PCURB6_11970 [Paenibacillus curdlanolyticus]
MDNEVSYSMHIVVTLIVLSVIIGMLSMFTSLSMSFKRDALSTIERQQAETYGSELVNAEYYGPLPAVSVFQMLKKNDSALGTLSGYVQGVFIRKPEDLISDRLISRKVRVDVELVNDRYNVEILEET